MTRLPRLTLRRSFKVLERKGFALVRQNGSHKIFRNPEGIRITVPFHSGKILHPKLLKSIMEDADLSVNDCAAKSSIIFFRLSKAIEFFSTQS